MPKRRTSYNLSALTDYQIRELSDKFELTATEVVMLAVDRLYRSQRWGLSAEQMDLSTLMYTLLHDRLNAATMGQMDRGAALAWCQRWLADNTDPAVLQYGGERWEDAGAAADAAVAAWKARR